MPEFYPTDRASLERDSDMEFIIASGPGGQHRNKYVRTTLVSTLSISTSDAGKTDFTGKKLICPNPLLNFGSTI